MESRELLGYVNPATKFVLRPSLLPVKETSQFTILLIICREWKEGLLPGLLRRFCLQRAEENFDFKAKPVMKIIQLDGEVPNYYVSP